MGLNAALAMSGRALEVFTAGIHVSGQNVANANSPGYIREELILETSHPYSTGGLVLGTGVLAEGVVQQIDQFLEKRLHTANADYSEVNALDKIYKQLEAEIRELGDNDLSTSLSNFLATLNDVANQPESEALRQIAVQEGEQFANDVASLRSRIDQLRVAQTVSIDSFVGEANELIEKIVSLNPQIARLEAAGLSRSDAGALRTQRYEALNRLSEIVPIRYQERKDGSVDVFTDSDYLIIAGIHQTLETFPTVDRNVQVQSVRLSKTKRELSMSATGGELRGITDGRDIVLGGFVDTLDSFASNLIFEFNRIHTSGQGLADFASVTSDNKVTDSTVALNAATSGLAFTPEHGSFDLKVTNKISGLTETTTIQIDLDGIGTDTTLTSLAADLTAVGDISATITANGRLQIDAAANVEFSFADDSSGVLATLGINTVALQKTIERKSQMQVNVATDRSLLNASEAALASVSDSLVQAKTLLIAGVGDTATDAEKLAMATEVASMIKGVVSTANTKFRGRFLFAGSETGQEPFAIAGGGDVRYSGDAQEINSYIDFDFLLANNVSGDEAFNALTDPVGNSVDPALTLDTRLADLNGGDGVPLGAIDVTIDNGGPVTQTVDLTGAKTIRDVQLRLQNAFPPGDLTVDLPGPPNGGSIRLTPVAGTVAVADQTGSTTARDLGIASAAAATITGSDIDPQLTLSTPLSAFNSGNGVNLTGGLTIVNGPINKTIDVSAATNVEELFNILRAENLDLDLRINTQKNGLAISSRLSGANFSIGENGGTAATDLGIRTFTGATLLDDLNFGVGVPVNNLDDDGNPIPAEIVINRRDGSQSTIDLQGLTTVQNVIDAITAVDANLTASLNTVGNGISIVDTSGAGPLEVVTGEVADALGLTGIEPGSVNTVPLTGNDVNERHSQGTLSLLVQLEAALRNGDNIELGRLDPLFDAEIQRLNLVRGEVGSRLKTIDEVDNRLKDQEVLLFENLSEEFDADIASVVAQVSEVSTALQGTLQIASATLNLSLLSAKLHRALLMGTAVGMCCLFGTMRQTFAQNKTAAKTSPTAALLKDFEKVISTADGKKSFYTIWTRKKDGQMLAELPANFANRPFFIALTVSSGERFAGLQAGDKYVYWRKFNNRLALIEPNVGTRSTGDDESKASVKRLFTDKILLVMPILATGPGGGPIIDMDALLVDQAPLFFGTRYVNRQFRGLHTIKKAKAFPENVELAFEVPTAGGKLQTLHYSFSAIPTKSGYKPRMADSRIGYFTTAYTDLGKYSKDETRVRFINRWHLEKADPKLKVSPPKNPIEFYIEHTTPVRYRRWVEQGILQWNAAFEKVGIHNAIKVYYQDAKTGAHMDKDPEDVRYNFVRWLNNNIGTAIGPSRVDPRTGQILDADIILTDGWIRHYRFQFNDILPKMAMEGFDAETLAWLAKHPNWDPRIRLAAPARRDTLKRTILRESLMPYAGHPLARVDNRMIGDDQYDGLVGRTSQVNGYCVAADGLAFDMAMMRMYLTLQNADRAEAAAKKEKKKGDPKKPEKKPDLIDGMPEEFVGPLLAHLVAHEVGHTLGLRHNFKGSSVHSLAEINSAKLKGKTVLGGSVMDYTPVNINVKGGKIQGDFAMSGIGPYDYWAIEYGYTFAKDLKPILARVAEPQLQFATDEDTGGPDPLARRYDFSRNPIDFAVDQMRLVKYHRERIIDKFVKNGDSWSRARDGYELTLSTQLKAISMMANWIGGTHVYRDHKGDKNGRAPIKVVDAKTQRDALKFVIDNCFHDKVYGLNTDLLSRMTYDKWLDGDNVLEVMRTEPAWPVHDKIMGLQASTLTMIMRPTVLRRVYDNEFRVPAKDDALTLPELMGNVTGAIWSELDKPAAGKDKFSSRNPMISSLRRNLQREHLKRLIDLGMAQTGSNESHKPITNIARMEMRKIQKQTEAALKSSSARMDAYTLAHLTEVKDQVAKALDARYTYNTSRATPMIFRLGRETEKPAGDR
eukprot:g12534.t1